MAFNSWKIENPKPTTSKFSNLGVNNQFPLFEKEGEILLNKSPLFQKEGN
jgi:hypothetical protein